MAKLLNVHAVESGQKLLAFLQRCLFNEDAELYRWIRSGQVRINSGRAKPNSRVQEGDAVRVPPFAQLRVVPDTLESVLLEAEPEIMKEPISGSVLKNLPEVLPEKLPECVADFSEYVAPVLSFQQKGKAYTITKIYENEHILILDKPTGLASQGGSGQRMNVVDILKEAYRDSRFVPAPAHRLDKETSGLLCVGKSYEALRFLSDFMQQAPQSSQETAVDTMARKEYLVWVQNTSLSLNTPFFMEHYVFQDEELGRMRALTQKNNFDQFFLGGDNLPQTPMSLSSCAQSLQELNTSGLPKGLMPTQTLSLGGEFEKQNLSTLSHSKTLKYALSSAVCLAVRGGYSLLKIGLFTGRKHQIRVQCAHLGMPVVGDKKYGEKGQNIGLKLHAYRLCLPENKKLYQKHIFETFPAWEGGFCVKNFVEPVKR